MGLSFRRRGARTVAQAEGCRKQRMEAQGKESIGIVGDGIALLDVAVGRRM